MRATCTAGTAAMLSLCIAVLHGDPQPGAASRAGEPVVQATQRTHLDARSTLQDLLRHPAFDGFAPLILPWDDRSYDERMPLSRISSLLPYHTHVDVDTVTSALNQPATNLNSEPRNPEPLNPRGTLERTRNEEPNLEPGTRNPEPYPTQVNTGVSPRHR